MREHPRGNAHRDDLAGHALHPIRENGGYDGGLLLVHLRDLTEICAPTPSREAARDLSRARENAQQDRMRCRHRLAKFLLRRGIAYTRGRKSWTGAHHAWLQTLSFEDPVAKVVFDEYRLAVAQLDAHVEAQDRRLEALAQEPRYRVAVGALRCFRGIDTRTALGLDPQISE